MGKNLVYLALGGNIGDVVGNFRRAIIDLEKAIELVDISPVYLSKPYGMSDQPNFLNAVFSAETTLSPFALLELIKNEEKLAGRDLSAPRYAPRPLDIDILLFDDLKIKSATLTIPHPALYKRDFFIVPLLDIISDEKVKNKLKISLEKIILKGRTYVIRRLEDISLKDLSI